MRDHSDAVTTITLEDDITINLDSISSNTGTYSITTTSDSDYTFDINNITSSTVSAITLDDTHWADNITWEQVEFEDQMPTVAKVEDMCKDYPALAKAYENFKTIYKMVHQDWKGKQDDDEEAPF
jgi:hypothetical protein